MIRHSRSDHPFLPRSSRRAGVIGGARMRGIGLIEVLISVLVLGIGLLGIAAMQSLALRGGQSSLESSQAVMQTSAIIEAMRANSANAAAYNGTYDEPPIGTSLVARDLNEWIAGLQGVANWRGVVTTPAVLAPDAQVTIADCPAACVITVQWNDARAGGPAARQIITETRI